VNYKLAPIFIIDVDRMGIIMTVKKIQGNEANVYDAIQDYAEVV